MKKLLILLSVISLFLPLILSSCEPSTEISNVNSEDISSEGSIDASKESSDDTSTETSKEEVTEGLNFYDIDKSGAKFCVSTGMPYNSTAVPNAGYPDDTGNQLTDAIYNTAGGGHDVEWVGYGLSNQECFITIDLGAIVSGISEFEFHYLHETGWAINPPTYVKVSASTDGKKFYEVAKIVDIPQDEDSTAPKSIYLESEKAFDAQFVRFSFSGSAFVFVDELAVFSYKKEAINTSVIKPTYTKAPDKINEDLPRVTCTYLNQGQHTAFTVEDWDNHFSLLKDAGIDSAVLLAGATIRDCKLSETLYTDTLNKRTDTCGDFSYFLGRMLESAEKNGIKCYIGLSISNDNSGEILANPTALANNLKFLEDVMHDIYAQYGKKYPNALHGWYISNELNNTVYDKYPDQCAQLINGYIDSANKLDKFMPIILSPYNVSWYGSVNSLYSTLKNVLSKTNFRKGDIFCPQDCVGTEIISTGANTVLKNSPKYFEAMKKAIDEACPNLSLWANCENFIKVDDTTLLGKLPANIDRFVKQMEVIKDYVDGYGTFMYSNYSPDISSSEYFHYEYIYYLNTGKTNGFKHVSNQELKIENETDSSFELVYYCDNGTYGLSHIVLSDGKTESTIGIQSKMLDKTIYRSRITSIVSELNSGESATITITPYDYANNKGETISITYTKK